MSASAREDGAPGTEDSAAVSGSLKFTSGKISLELASEAGVVILEHEDSKGHGLPIDVPRGWAPDLEQFTLWCCRFLGILLDDKPVYVVERPPHHLGDGTCEVVLKGVGNELAEGAVLAPVPEASS